MVTRTISQARASLPELLTRVEDGEEVTITRHGRPVAVLVRPDVMRSRASVIIEIADRIHQLVSESEPPAESGDGEDVRSSEQAITLERAEELVREIRAGRDAR